MEVRKICMSLILGSTLFFHGCSTSDTPADHTLDVPCDTADLAQAITEANALAPAVTTLELAADCEYILDDLSDSDDGISVLPTITSSIIINGQQASFKLLKDGDDPAKRMLNISPIGSLTLTRLLLETENPTGGYGGSDPLDQGGVIFNTGELFIEGVTFYKNFANVGGSVYNTGTMTVIGSLFDWNHTVGGAGAIYSEGDLQLSSTTFTRNTIYFAGYGGGIFQNGGSLIIDDSVFEQNRSTGHGVFGGGAIAQIEGSLQISNTLFDSNSNNSNNGLPENSARAGYPRNSGGGAIFMMAVDFSVESTTFKDNSARNHGGAISFSREVWIYDSSYNATADSQGFVKNPLDEDYNPYSSPPALYIHNCDFQGNQSENSETAIYVHDADIQITYSTFNGNNGVPNSTTISTLGGGNLEIRSSVFANNDTPFATIYDGWASLSVFSNTTFSQNSGPIKSDGGLSIISSTITQNTSSGIRFEAAPSGSPLMIENSIVANNAGGDCDFDSTVNAVGENLDSDGSCTDFTITADPLLGPLADNGGPTRTHALPSNSPAIGAGAGPCIGVDQRDVVRPSYACDLGAYEDTSIEVQVPVETSTMPSPTETPTPEPEIVDRCALFEELEIKLFMLDIPPGSTTQTIYLVIPGGVPGQEFEIPGDIRPWLYSAVLGSAVDEECTFEGYAQQLYCTFQLEKSALGTYQELFVSVNECDRAFYTNPFVTIFDPDDGQSPGMVCASGLGKTNCEAAGGVYKDSSNIVSPFCDCSAP